MDPVSGITNDLSAVNVSQRETARTSTFQWKVDAPEFVPRYMMASGAVSTASSSTPSGIGPVSSISYAAVASGASAASSAAALAPGGVSADVLASTTFDYVHWLLNELQDRPETFENLCNDLLSYIQENLFNDEILISSVLSPILEAALSVDNFAFLCVRLIVFLHDNYAPSASPNNQGIQIPIRDCILTCLEKEFAARKNVIKMPEQTPRLFMFVNVLCMFSTLLLMNGQALNPLITAVYDILDLIMNERTEENVRFSIQTLKTVGAHLECAEKAETGDGTTPRMDALIDHLERIGTEPDSKLSDNTKFMIRNLRGVRRHWAYAAPPNPSSPQQQQLEQQQLQQPNFCHYEDQSSDQSTYLDSSFNYENYGTTADLSAAALYFTPDSSAALYFTPASLTPAEAAFFERVCIEGSSAAAGGDGDTQNNTSSEDDVIADAYEEFLKHMQPPGQQ